MIQEKMQSARPLVKMAGLIGMVLVITCAILLHFQQVAAAPPQVNSLPSISEGGIPSGDEAGAYPPPEISVADITITEGDSGVVQAIFTIIRTGYLEVISAVNYSTSDGSAVQPGDYTSKAGTLVFDRTVDSQTVTVDVHGDTLNELDENFFLDLTQPVDADVVDGQAQCTITNDDPLPQISIADVTVAEGDSGTATASFHVTLDTASGQNVSIYFSTADDSANQPADYQLASGTLTFLPGEIDKTVDVSINGDQLDEEDETFFVGLSGPANGTLLDDQALGTISDDDPPPDIHITGLSVVEGDSGTTDLAFNLSLTAASAKTITVEYATADDTALQPGDYLPASGTVTFIPGDTSESLAITVNGDVLTENDELVRLDLSNPVNATLADTYALGTIIDDDLLPEISIQDVTVTEGDSGTAQAFFSVTLSAASSKTISVDFASANGTAVQPADYLPASGLLTFQAGDVSESIAISIVGDSIDEPDETFLVNLANPTNATLLDAQASGTITDDDLPPEISIADVSVIEGDSGTSTASFTVTLDNPSGKTVSVDFATANGSASQPADYQPASGTLTFAPGDLSESFTVSIVGDLLDETDETFLVNLANPTNATLLDAQASGTITDDDLPPGINIADVSVIEGDSGTSTASFTVTLNNPSGKTVSVDFATANGSASQPADYQPASGTLTFTPGDLSESFTVSIVGDLLDETDETFLVNLSNPVNAALLDGQATGTITDDDPPPGISIADVTAAEGDSGTSGVTFTVTLNNPSGKTVSVDFAASDSSATQPEDYLPVTGTLTFLAGDTSETIAVSIVGDLIDEPDEVFLVDLANPLYGRIADGQALGTITDDDPPPQFSIADVTLEEGDSGNATATFTVSLSTASSRWISVNYSTASGTANTHGDYLPASGTLTYAPGEVSETIQVSVIGDVLDEFDETFFVNLTTPVHASLPDTQALGTITDDDLPPNITVEDVTVMDSGSSNVLATFVIRLDAPSGKTVSVDYATQDDSATAPSDYTAASGSITFNPGQTLASVSITVRGSTGIEPTEQFFLNLSGALNAFLADNQAVATILETYQVFMPIIMKSGGDHWYHPP